MGGTEEYLATLQHHPLSSPLGLQKEILLLRTHEADWFILWDWVCFLKVTETDNFFKSQKKYLILPGC